MISLRRVPLACALAALALVSVLPAKGSAGGETQVPREPKLLRLDYWEALDGGERRYSLSANARRATSVTFTARYRGRSRTAGSRRATSTIVPGIRGKARHPWKVNRDRAGKRVLRMIRRALSRRGVARLRIVARGPGGFAREWVRIELAECTRNPPIYPVTCVIWL